MKEIQNAAPIKQSGMGKAFPLGATITQEGCNFAVYAPDAKAVVLCFFNSDTEEALDEFPLPEKTGDVWHGLFGAGLLLKFCDLICLPLQPPFARKNYTKINSSYIFARRGNTRNKGVRH